MNKEQALQVLDQAVSQIQTTRQNHATLVAALEYLKGLKEEEVLNAKQ